MNTIVLLSFVFIFGACIGSFLNALIYRLPREIDLKFKRSGCPKCNKIIPWYENIPILSYIILKGKCSKCFSKIPTRYLLIELYVAISAVIMFPYYSLSLNSLLLFSINLAILSVFISLFFIDLEFKILPDLLNLYLFFIFILYSFLYLDWKLSLIGAAIGFGFPLLITWLFYLVKGQVGLGGGDIKLFGILGIYLGPIGILQTLFLSCFLGSLIGGILLVFKIIKRSEPIPFGPFILIIASIQIFFPIAFSKGWNYFF